MRVTERERMLSKWLGGFKPGLGLGKTLGEVKFSLEHEEVDIR